MNLGTDSVGQALYGENRSWAKVAAATQKGSFQEALTKAGGNGAEASGNTAGNGALTSLSPERQAQIRTAASGTVSTALILPVLKQLRRSTFASGSVFTSGMGDSTFGTEFDMHIADRIAQSPKMQATVEALAERLAKSSPVTASGPTKVGGHG